MNSSRFFAEEHLVHGRRGHFMVQSAARYSFTTQGVCVVNQYLAGLAKYWFKAREAKKWFMRGLKNSLRTISEGLTGTSKPLH